MMRVRLHVVLEELVVACLPIQLFLVELQRRRASRVRLTAFGVSLVLQLLIGDVHVCQ